MRLRLIIWTLLLLACAPARAKTVTVEGSSVFIIPSTMSRAEAEAEAIRRAKIDALNNAFGNSIIASSTSIITEKDERFYRNGFDLVKGEWIETIGEPEIKTGLDGEEIYITVRIKGKARKKDTADIDIAVKILRNGTTLADEASDFRNGDKMYLYFKSPADGYISVYQHDPVNDMVYCLLPYRKDGSGSVRVEHDREYVFFSKALSDNPHMVDEYRLGCKADGEANTIYVMFSPKVFSKSSTNSTDRYTPRNLPFADFERWKSRCQAQDAQMQVVALTIIIDR